MACYNFAGIYTVAGCCAACRRSERLRNGYCRLCWCQASLERPTGPNTPLAPYLAAVRHHQLFLADLNARRAAPRALPRRYGAKGRPLKAPPPPMVQPRIEWLQLQLFDDVIPRRYRYGRVDLRSAPALDNPWLAWALHVAHTMAEARGFEPVKRRILNRTMVMLLADHRDGETIRTSDFQALVRRHGDSVEHAVEVLQAMGVLFDDRPATFETWLVGKLDGLAPGIGAETGRWIRALRDGGPRSRARDEGAVRGYLYAARPALAEWSVEHDHLREVTRDDVLTHANPLVGRQRQMTLGAIRSLFTWAKKNGVVFTNPASRIRIGRVDDPVWQPLHHEQIAQTIEVATTPQTRLVVALASVHAARSGAIRALMLDHVDLPNRRLTIAGRSRPLDELTRRLLLEWLDYRASRWPNTANQHLLISRESAVNLGPVSQPGIAAVLRGLPATLERLRIDRQLEEALTHGADPLHLAVVFEISDTTAVRYAANARQLLERPHESRPAPSQRTQGSTGDDERSGPSGSR